MYQSGESDVDQLQKIFKVLGTPQEGDWEGVELLPKYVQFQPTTAISLLPLFGNVSEDKQVNGQPSSLDLLLKLLLLNPLKRCSCAEVYYIFMYCFLSPLLSIVVIVIRRLIMSISLSFQRQQRQTSCQFQRKSNI